MIPTSIEPIISQGYNKWHLQGNDEANFSDKFVSFVGQVFE
jgi:hypothetical protein